MEFYFAAFLVTGASIVCGMFLVNEAYKHPIG